MASRRLQHVLAGVSTPVAPATVSASEDPVVATSKGVVQGFVDGHGINTFRGVPFAAPPVGALRFRRSAPCPAWEGTLGCTEFGCISPQARPSQVPAEQICDENCLYLNVQNAAGSTNVPVFVYIHGGGFRQGAGSEPLYDSPTMVLDGICVVTINYRLGALGWMKATDGDANCGLWDQIAALQWVQDEIAGFGGDPHNVTVGGESAGGSSVLSLLASPTANALFHKAIPMSAMPWYLTLAEADTMAAGFAAELGEVDASQAALAKYSADDLIAAEVNAKISLNIAPGWQDIEGAMAGNESTPPLTTVVNEGSRLMRREEGLGGFAFNPTADGELLASTHQLLLLGEGVASHINVLVGSDRDEMAFKADRTSPKASMPNTFGHWADSRKRFVEQVVHELRGFGDPCTAPPWGEELHALAETVAAAYIEEYGDGEWQACMDRFCSDASFNAATLMCAQEQAKVAPDATWAYRWDGSQGNYAFHGWEVMFLFDTSPPGFLDRAPLLKDTADNFRAAFVSLMKNGDPNCEEVPRWEPFEGTQKELGIFGGDDDQVRVCATAEEHSAIHVLVDTLSSLMRFE